MSSTFGLQVTARGFSEATYGALISLNGVFVVLFELPLTRITQRFPSKPVMAVGYVLIGVGFALNAFASTIPAFVVAMSIFTLGEIVAMPVSTAYIANLAPENLRGRYMGTFGFTWSLALMFGPAAGMALFGVSPLALWLCCGAFGLIAAAIILRWT
jgi:MFS family permease